MFISNVVFILSVQKWDYRPIDIDLYLVFIRRLCPIGYFRVLNVVLHCIQWALVDDLFFYFKKSVYILIPTSYFIPHPQYLYAYNYEYLSICRYDHLYSYIGLTISLYTGMGFPRGTKEPAYQCRRPKRCRFNPCFRKVPWSRAWQPTAVFFPGESCRQRSLKRRKYGPWDMEGEITLKEQEFLKSCSERNIYISYKEINHSVPIFYF